MARRSLLRRCHWLLLVLTYLSVLARRSAGQEARPEARAGSPGTNSTPATIVPWSRTSNATPRKVEMLTPAQISRLPLETRRTLMHLYARLDRADLAVSVARVILRDSPSDKPTLELLLALQTSKGDTTGAADVTPA